MIINQKGELLSWTVPSDPVFSDNPNQAVRIDDYRIAVSIWYRDNATGDRQFKLEVIDNDGNHLWERIHGDPNIVEPPQAITYSNGRIVMTGSRTINGDQDIFIVAWDTAGNFLWDRAIGSPTNNENSYTIVPMDDGGYMVGGYQDYTSLEFKQSWRWYLARVDSVGVVIWQKSYPNLQHTAQSICRGILKTAEGKYYAYGIFQSVFFPNDEWVIRVLEIDSLGNILNDIRVMPDNTPISSIYSAVEDASGNIYFAGAFRHPQYIKDYGWLFKLDSNRAVEWSRSYYYSASHHNYLRDIVQTPDGGFLMVGSVLVSPNDAWVVKVDSMGCLEPGCHLGTGTGPQYTGPAVQLYPNPVQHTLTIALPEGVHQASAIITNISGQVVYASTHISGTQTVSTSGWPAGVYLVQVATEAGLWHGKVVKVE